MFLEKIRISPNESVATILMLLSALYVLFFATQLQYFTMGFAGVVPQGYTVAEYARQGFFELIRISAVNLSVLAVAAKIAKKPIRNNKHTKSLSALLMIFNIAFSVISFSKLGLYIGYFGLTPKRLLAGYVVCVIAVWSVLSILTLKKPFRAVVWAVRFASFLFCVLCFINWQKIIA